MKTIGNKNQASALGWMSHAEINFLKVLNQTISDNAFVFTKIRINDLVDETLFANKQNLTRDFGDEVFDFVICERDDLSVICVIQLDDRSQPARESHSEESYKKICREAGLNLLEIPAMCGYDLAKLKNSILSHSARRQEDMRVLKTA
ncbi:MAG: DUF2726 domain-containing protein [Pseudomonadota bacterium]